MRNTKVVSLSLPPELVRKLELVARREGRTRSALFQEIAERYLAESNARARLWKEAQQYARGRAKDDGVRTAEDVRRAIQEFRGGDMKPYDRSRRR